MRRLEPTADVALDYTPVTETPGIGADEEQLSRLYHRYHAASGYSAGKRVLEVACGAGIGLGYLARTASAVVGGDYTRGLLRLAHHHYKGRVPLLQFDAQALPFRDHVFDTIILFEALYYLADTSGFLQECQRILSPEGTLVISIVNKEWAEFNPSPLSTNYYSASELFELLKEQGFHAELFGAFPALTGSTFQMFVSRIKRAAVKLHLIPKSMRAKQLLRRVFLGRLFPLPNELDPGIVKDAPLTPITLAGPVTEYKILYAIAHRACNLS